MLSLIYSTAALHVIRSNSCNSCLNLILGLPYQWLATLHSHIHFKRVDGHSAKSKRQRHKTFDKKQKCNFSCHLLVLIFHIRDHSCLMSDSDDSSFESWLRRPSPPQIITRPPLILGVYNHLSCFKIFYHTQLYFPKLIFNTLLLFLEPKDKEKRSWINATLGLNNFGLPWSPGGAPWQPDLSPPSTSHPPQLYPSSPSLVTLSASLSSTTILRCKMTNMVDMKVDESGCTFEEELQAKDELRCTI